MPSKTKTEKKQQTKLFAAVCKRACAMRAPFRGSAYPTAKISQTNKNSSLKNKNKQQLSLIKESSKEKTVEKVGANQLNKYRFLMDVLILKKSL